MCYNRSIASLSVTLLTPKGVCMNKKVSAAVAAILLALGGAGYTGKSYFDSHYILLDEEDIAAIGTIIKMNQMGAYEAGVAACKKTT